MCIKNQMNNLNASGGQLLYPIDGFRRSGESNGHNLIRIFGFKSRLNRNNVRAIRNHDHTGSSHYFVDIGA